MLINVFWGVVGWWFGSCQGLSICDVKRELRNKPHLIRRQLLLRRWHFLSLQEVTNATTLTALNQAYNRVPRPSEAWVLADRKAVMLHVADLINTAPEARDEYLKTVPYWRRQQVLVGVTKATAQGHHLRLAA